MRPSRGGVPHVGPGGPTWAENDIFPMFSLRLPQILVEWKAHVGASPHRLRKLRKNPVLYQGTTLVVPQVIDNALGFSRWGTLSLQLLSTVEEGRTSAAKQTAKKHSAQGHYANQPQRGAPCWAPRAQTPGFPAKLRDADDLHAAFFEESRTRGSGWSCVQEIRGRWAENDGAKPQQTLCLPQAPRQTK